MADGRVTGFWHSGVTVKDMGEALRFYRDTLGLEIEDEYEIKGDYAGPIVGLDPESMLVVFLTVPNSEAKIELFEYRASSDIRRPPVRATTAPAISASTSTISTRFTHA